MSIKVDREERPDVDKIYMTFVQAMTGQGGWPLNVFLAPDLKLVSVEITTGRPGDPVFHSGGPHALLAAPSNKSFRYAVARDSKRLLLSATLLRPKCAYGAHS